jgi:plastocyanin
MRGAVPAFQLSALGLLCCSLGVVSAHAAIITVTIAKMAFSPAEISVRVGDTVEWVNKDAFAHTATFKSGSEVVLPLKKSGSITVEGAETVDYFCRFHPNMKGRITVTAP